MEKSPADPKFFGILRYFAEFARSHDLPLEDITSQEAFVKKLSMALVEHASNPIMIHGLRIQTMFAYFAAALDGCRIISEEDSGDFYTESQGLKRPDFRILINEGNEIFVEVKNFNQSEAIEPFTLKFDYATSLLNYSNAFQKPLFFAVYWRRLQIWTLTHLSDFTSDGKIYSLSFVDAIKNDQKATLGDCLIGISKPLTFRFYTDPEKPRRVNSDGGAGFTIKRVGCFAGGEEILDDFEKRLAWFFFQFGRWDDIDQPACIKNSELISFDLTGVRDDPNPKENFLIIGYLSEMISRQFNAMTIKDGEVAYLSPKVELGKLGVKIPNDYQGKVLKIWRFMQKPANSTYKP